MNSPNIYCNSHTGICHTMAEWGVYWQALTAIFTLIIGFVGLYKIYRELERLFEQRKKDIDDKAIAAKLKRTEFFLNQHRRLFDNEELYSVLCLLDGDEDLLATSDGMADKKRKLLTFFEEIALLVRSEQIDKNVAYYMFGYYVIRALDGDNFKEGIDLSPQYWGLLYEFSGAAQNYLSNYPDGPPTDMTL